MQPLDLPVVHKKCCTIFDNYDTFKNFAFFKDLDAKKLVTFYQSYNDGANGKTNCQHYSYDVKCDSRLRNLTYSYDLIANPFIYYFKLLNFQKREI